MVIRIKPKTLVEISSKALVKHLIHAFEKVVDLQDKQHKNEIELKKVIQSKKIPYFILHKIFDPLFTAYVNLYLKKADITTKNEIPFLCSLLTCILEPMITVLDLNYLLILNLKLMFVLTASKKNEILNSTQQILIKQIPCMNNLVELNLKSHKTISICDDTILKLVGKHCPRLKFLDVSHNIEVTDIGVKFLIPSKYHSGCSELNKVCISYCSVTVYGVVFLIKGLPQLKHLDYKYIAVSLMKLALNEKIKTKLNHLLLPHELKIDEMYALTITCPELQVLKVYMSDPQIFILKTFKELCQLDLSYRSKNMLTSPGSITTLYLRNFGRQLISLSMTCQYFSTQLLKLICEKCQNLKSLTINCKSFLVENEELVSNHCLVNLKSFSFTVGDKLDYNYQTCSIPYNVFHYVLKNSHALEVLYICMTNDLLDEQFMEILLKSINLCKLQSLFILASEKKVTPSSIKLNLKTFYLILNVCPQLIKLGNIFQWDLSLEEVYFVIKLLKSTNCVLECK